MYISKIAKFENFISRALCAVACAYDEVDEQDRYHSIRNGILRAAREAALIKGECPQQKFELAHDIAQSHADWHDAESLAKIEKWLRLKWR